MALRIMSSTQRYFRRNCDTCFCALGLTETSIATPPIIKKIPKGTGIGNRMSPMIMIKIAMAVSIIAGLCRG